MIFFQVTGNDSTLNGSSMVEHVTDKLCLCATKVIICHVQKVLEDEPFNFY